MTQTAYNQIPPEIRTFLRNIMLDCGFRLNPHDEQEAIIEMCADYNMFLGEYILVHMPQKYHAEYIQIVREGRGDKLEQFLKATVPNCETVMRDAAEQFRQFYLQAK